MATTRTQTEQCQTCGDAFRHEQRLWAVDCDGNIAVGCHSRRGIWYGGDGMVRLELPQMVWTSALCPGEPPVCDDCIARREF